MLSINPGRKGWQNESSIIFPTFLFGGSKKTQLKGALFFQLPRQPKGNEMRRKSKPQHRGISATGKLARLPFFAPDHRLSPR